MFCPQKPANNEPGVVVGALGRQFRLMDTDTLAGVVFFVVVVPIGLDAERLLFESDCGVIGFERAIVEVLNIDRKVYYI